MTERDGAALLRLGIDYRVSPATERLTPGGEKGSLRYGRRSGLKPVRQLAYDDLICFTVRTVGELEAALNGLVVRGVGESQISTVVMGLSLVIATGPEWSFAAAGANAKELQDTRRSFRQFAKFATTSLAIRYDVSSGKPNRSSCILSV